MGGPGQDRSEGARLGNSNVLQPLVASAQQGQLQGSLTDKGSQTAPSAWRDTTSTWPLAASAAH